MTSLPRAAWWQPAPAAGVEPPLASVREDESRAGGGVAFRALIVFMVILLLAPQNHLVALRPLRLALVAAVVGVIARLVENVRGGRALTVGGRAMAITGGLVGWAVATAPLSYWPGGSAGFLMDSYFKTVAIFWLLANAVDTLARLSQMAWTLTWLSVPLALTGLKHFLAGMFIEAGHAVKRVEGYDAGLTGNPNDLALMLNLILPLSLVLLVTTRKATARALLLVVVALQVACVIVTFSRTGFITLAVVITLFAWRLLRRGRPAWSAALLAVALVGLVFVPSGYMERLATITDIDSDVTGSAQARVGDTRAALEFVRSHPVIGAGIGMNALAVNEIRGATWTLVHNAYLEYAVELGLPGLILFLLLLVTCLRTVRRVRWQGQALPGLDELSWLSEGICIAIVAFAVAAFFHPVAYHFYFYCLAGLAVAAGALYEKATGRAGAARPAEAPAC